MRQSDRLQVVYQTIHDSNISTGTFQPLVLPQLQENFVTSLHTIHHPGVRATKWLVSTRFCWPFLAKKVTALVGTCLSCQRGKVYQHVHLQQGAIPVPH